MMGESKAEFSSNHPASNISGQDKVGRADCIKCHHCAGPLSKDMETSRWTVPPLIRDSFSMIGSAVGGVTSAFYGFNHVMPVVQRRIKGPMWLHFLIGAPPIIVFSSACAGLAGGSVPALAQLASSSYHATASSLSLRPSSQEEDNLRKPRVSQT
ncbi:OLC1v1025713C3 [Oldenlandia corymbosa var. corymbosa]|uniref:OLC1v1025713C3 n=1 Tax=Oldenlandia corymbosa var. corymbosa TaxID=529605 RepID=A0AAV1C764_OLDCO|nr:OLC1v1025713C3 [Oldenlandia corymbosa var. corymbosa]